MYETQQMRGVLESITRWLRVGNYMLSSLKRQRGWWECWARRWELVKSKHSRHSEVWVNWCCCCGVGRGIWMTGWWPRGWGLKVGWAGDGLAGTRRLEIAGTWSCCLEVGWAWGWRLEVGWAWSWLLGVGKALTQRLVRDDGWAWTRPLEGEGACVWGWCLAVGSAGSLHLVGWYFGLPGIGRGWHSVEGRTSDVGTVYEGDWQGFALKAGKFSIPSIRLLWRRGIFWLPKWSWGLGIASRSFTGRRRFLLIGFAMYK